MIKILGIDPSGNWNEKRGKGKTGFALWIDGEIKSTCTIDGHDSFNKLEYWNEIVDFVFSLNPHGICCEEFILYREKAEQQYWDSMDTPRLLGVLEFQAKNIPFILQQASLVKPRWTNEILMHKGIITPYGKTKSFALTKNSHRLCDHELDAIRHVLHGVYFNKQIKELIKNEEARN